MSNVIEFKLPDIGEGVHEGEIVKWLVKAGDIVKVDQPLVEVMTDKATVEIPSAVEGTVQSVMAKEGDTVKVGQLLLTFGAAAASAPAAPSKAAAATAAPLVNTPPPAAVAPTVAQAPAPKSPTAQAIASASAPTSADAYMASPGFAGDSSTASPATRRLARELGINLLGLKGSGPNGRVLKDDVQNAVGGAVNSAIVARSTSAPVMPSYTPPARLGPSAGGPPETLVPFRGIRRKISEAMVLSRTTIPEFTYVDEVDVTELVAFRAEAKELAQKRGVKLTYLPFIVKAMVAALKQFPSMNASLDEHNGNIIYKNYYNIGIAVDTEQGLVVPNVKNADQKSILQIASEIQDLAERARLGKLQLDEMKGGTITVTNPGPIGGLFTAPVINWPEVAIIGVHKIIKRPVVKDNAIAIADMMYLSLAVDHRIVDGATAARFCNVLIEYLSQPKKLMLDMY